MVNKYHECESVTTGLIDGLSWFGHMQNICTPYLTYLPLEPSIKYIRKMFGSCFKSSYITKALLGKLREFAIKGTGI